MANKIIKFRLFTWFEEVPSPVMPGQTVLRERIVHLGEEADITNELYLQRGEELGAFYTDEEADQIRAGTYRGYDREALMNARAGLRPPSPIEPAEGEGVQVAHLSTEELAAYIAENRLTVPQTTALVPPDADMETLNKFADAEGLAAENEPRKGVMDFLEARMAARSQVEAPA